MKKTEEVEEQAKHYSASWLIEAGQEATYLYDGRDLRLLQSANLRDIVIGRKAAVIFKILPGISVDASIGKVQRRALIAKVGQIRHGPGRLERQAAQHDPVAAIIVVGIWRLTTWGREGGKKRRARG